MLIHSQKELVMSTTTDINRSSVARLEIAGDAFILLLGGALHFAFEWSNNFPILAPSAAVNESDGSS